MTLLGDQLQPVSISGSPSGGAGQRPNKQSKPANKVSKSSKTHKTAVDDSMAVVEDNATTPPNTDKAEASSSKPKRVRTGCLTCRERHLKCDEGLPHCQNCRKSSRTCKRGVRLNFIDTKVEDPQIIPPTSDWSVGFQDESREIASEYKGGAGRYAALKQEAAEEIKDESQMDTSGGAVNAPMMAHQPLPPIHALPQGVNTGYSDGSSGMQDSIRDPHHRHGSHSTIDSYSSHTLHAPSQASYASSETLQTQDDGRDYLTSPEETLFMQVFVEEVGLWMDSMDPHKHVSQIATWLFGLTDTLSSPEYYPFMHFMNRCCSMPF